MIELIALLQLSVADPTRSYPFTINQRLERPANSKLVWSDEFGGRSLDRSKWRFDTARNKLGWHNNEKQYYSANRGANTQVANGSLVITARRDGDKLKRYSDWGGQRYSSARLLSTADWTYGYYEIRAKLPCTGGIWPAIWMLPPDMKKWPEDGEIDIMEMVGKAPGEVHATLHTGAYNHSINTQREAIRMVPTACTAFHTYQLEWKPDAIRIGVDGVAFLRVPNNKPAEGKAAWPFDRPFRMILNLAVGGDWPGPVDDEALPQRMEVDYVRVWQ